MKIRIQKRSIVAALFVATYLLKAFTDGIFVAAKVGSIWTGTKYIAVFAMMAYGMYYLSQFQKTWRYWFVVRRVGITVLTFLVISGLKILYTGTGSLAAFKGLLHMLLAPCIAFVVLNVLDSDTIYKCMCWILCGSLVAYVFFEIGVDLFTFAQIKLISFATSYSPFESHYSSGMAVALCSYFSYYRKNKLMSFLALLYSLLTFKRLLVVFSLFIYVLPLFYDVRKRLSRYPGNTMALGFIIITVLYYWYMLPQNQAFLESLFQIESLSSFTSGRAAFFNKVYSGIRYVDYGFGSTEHFLGRSMEMDLIQILMEVSIVGLAVFSFQYWQFAGTTRFGLLYMTFNFLNMLTSHSVQNAFIWGIVLLTFVVVEEEQVLHTAQTGKRRIRVRWRRQW